jgi:hypothetical protein
LGYNRFRLKRYQRLARTLVVCHHNSKRTPLEYQIQERSDYFAFEAIRQSVPLLFIYDPTRRAPQMLGYCLYHNQRLHEDPFEKEGVERWVDIPLMAEKGPDSITPFGVLAVDKGHDSSTLSIKDLAVLKVVGCMASVMIDQFWNPIASNAKSDGNDQTAPRDLEANILRLLDRHGFCTPMQIEIYLLRQRVRNGEAMPAPFESVDVVKTLEAMETKGLVSSKEIEGMLFFKPVKKRGFSIS